MNYKNAGDLNQPELKFVNVLEFIAVNDVRNLGAPFAIWPSLLVAPQVLGQMPASENERSHPIGRIIGQNIDLDFA